MAKDSYVVELGVTGSKIVICKDYDLRDKVVALLQVFPSAVLHVSKRVEEDE